MDYIQNIKKDGIIKKTKSLKLTDVIENICTNGKLQYLFSPLPEINIFRCISYDKEGNEFSYMLKMLAHDKGNKNITKKPTYVDILMSQFLAQFVIKSQTPHILLPSCTFNTNIEQFVNLIDDEYVDKNTRNYKEFVQRYKDKTYENKVSILLSEYPNRWTFHKFINKHSASLKSMHWKVLFFQILSVMAVIQSAHPNFRHNNLKCNTVYVNKLCNKKMLMNYTIQKNKFKVPNIGYHVLISDFDFASISDVIPNEKVKKQWAIDSNITDEQNRYYDIHFFFNSLQSIFFPNFLKNPNVPQDAKDFVRRLIPKNFRNNEISVFNSDYDSDYDSDEEENKNISEHGRLLAKIEVCTPINVLLHDPYFSEFNVNNKQSTFDPDMLYFYIPPNWELVRINKESADETDQDKIDNETDNETDQEYLCPVSYKKISTYFCKCATCGNKFNYDVITEWLQKKETCPTCRSYMNKVVCTYNVSENN